MADEKSLSFQGEVKFSGNRAAQCVATIRYQQWNPEELSVDFLWLGDDDAKRGIGQALRYLDVNYLWVDSLDAYHLPIELLGITEVSSQSMGSSIHSSRVGVSAVQVGINNAQVNTDKKLNISVRLQPSGILCLPTIHNQIFTGEVTIESVENGTVEIDVGGGKLEARETYEYNKHEQNGDKVTDRIQRATILGNITINKGNTLWDAHELLKNKLRVACSALSLCYRQTVDFYEIEYLEVDSSPPVRSLYRRKWPNCKKKFFGDELINTRSLIGGGLQRLIDGIESLDRREDIHRAIQFLANSYEETPVTAYFMAFSAMETIVSCCLDKEDEYIARSAKWRKIERTLKETIRNQLDSELHGPLMDKLPELKRQALTTRIEAVCKKLHPKTDDLWSTLSFKEGIERAASIRNGLFHSANAKTESTLVFDLIRIRHFSERLLLKLIGWSDEDVWIWYDQQLKWINLNEH